MDFFARQDRARRNTHWLVFYFVLSVLLTIALVYVAFALMFLGKGEAQGLARFWNVQLFAGVTAGTLLVILLGNITKMAALSKGGGAVARMLGGQLISSNTTDPDERKLLNVVEEMAIASGTAVPEVYVLPREEGINAFAAGHEAKDAAIGVTRGCMRLLTRDELQGVIAHEFSHILNGDMRMNLRLMGIVFGLLCLTIIGRILLYSSSRNSRYSGYSLGARDSGRGANPLPILGLALIVVGSVGVFFGRLIKSAVSRQREFLADAAAVQFTRNPGGLAGALKKIGGLAYGSRLQSAHAEEASHMFFGNGLAESWLQAFATHPPLVTRIKAIEPDFDGSFPRVTALLQEPTSPRTAAPAVSPPPSQAVQPPQLADLLGTTRGVSSAVPPPLPGAQLLQHLGMPQAGHLDFAVQLMASLPESVTASVRDPWSASALVYALLLSPEVQVRSKQLEALGTRLQTAIQRELGRLLPVVQSLDPLHRLPLVELAFPALRQFSPAQYLEFRTIIREIIESDQELDLFEFALQKMLIRHLDPHYRPVKRTVVQFYVLRPLWLDAMVLLSALAHVGQPESGQAERAFSLGLKSLAQGEAEERLLPIGDCNLTHIDRALDRFNQAALPIKKALLTASVQTVAADGKVQPREAELLRAIADALDCPMPPVLPAA
jgi:Zn-dependent protease with chaperone function